MSTLALMEQPKIDPDVPPVWWVFPLWFLATTTSGVVGWAVATVVAFFIWVPGVVGIMTVAGACVGVAQWFVLQPYTWSSNRFWAMARWVGLSAIGGTIAWWTIILIRMFSVVIDDRLFLDPLFAPIVFFIGGGIFGLAQWLTWGVGYSWALAWWAQINAIGWSAGGMLGVRVGEAVFRSLFPNHLESILARWEDSVPFLVAGAVAIPIYGLITAVGLLVVLRKPNLQN